MKRARAAVAIAMASVACVKVSDSVKATFAENRPSEVDNFALGAPHGFAPSEARLSRAVVAVDASLAGATDASAMSGVMCTREASAGDTSNCMQDAGTP